MLILEPSLVPSRAELGSRTYDEVTLFDLGNPILWHRALWRLIRWGGLHVRCHIVEAQLIVSCKHGGEGDEGEDIVDSYT